VNILSLFRTSQTYTSTLRTNHRKISTLRTKITGDYPQLKLITGEYKYLDNDDDVNHNNNKNNNNKNNNNNNWLVIQIRKYQFNKMSNKAKRLNNYAIDTVKVCEEYFNFELASVMIEKRKKTFRHVS